MTLCQISKAAPKSALLLAVCLFLLTACGPIGAPSGASATATACAQVKQPLDAIEVKTGTLNSINGKTLVLNDTKGKNITVTYSNTTTFAQEVKLAPGALKKGTPVSILVKSTGSTYTAVSIRTGLGTGPTVNGGPGGGPGPGGAPGSKGTPVIINGGPGDAPGSSGPPVTNSNSPCLHRSNATPKTGNPDAHALLGTVSQVNGTLLTIADFTGSLFTITLTAQTQIIGTQNVSASSLKVREPLTVIGKPGSQNAFAASTIEILLNLPE